MNKAKLHNIISKLSEKKTYALNLASEKGSSSWLVSRDSALSFLSELMWFGLGSSSLEKLLYRCICGKLNCDLDRAGRFLWPILPMLLGPQVFSTSRCLGTIELSVFFRPFLVSSTVKTLENQALKRLNFCSLLEAVSLIFFGGVAFLVPSFWELFALVKWLQIFLQSGHSSAVHGFLERSLVVSNLQVFPLLVLFDRNRKAVLFFLTCLDASFCEKSLDWSPMIVWIGDGLLLVIFCLLSLWSFCTVICGECCCSRTAEWKCFYYLCVLLVSIM